MAMVIGIGLKRLHNNAAQQAVAADRLWRGYAWRTLPSIVLVSVASLARVGGG